MWKPYSRFLAFIWLLPSMSKHMHFYVTFLWKSSSTILTSGYFFIFVCICWHYVKNILLHFWQVYGIYTLYVPIWYFSFLFCENHCWHKYIDCLHYVCLYVCLKTLLHLFTLGECLTVLQYVCAYDISFQCGVKNLIQNLNI